MSAEPSSWATTTILDASSKIMDYRGRTPKKLGMEWGGGSIPAISARNVRMGRIDFSEEYYVGSDALYLRWMSQGDMEKGDSLITMEAPLGNVAAVPDNRKYILSQRTVLLRPKPELLDKAFFTQVLQSPDFQQSLRQGATGSTAVGIQRKRLERLTVPLPPLSEQRGIAAVIADAADLIAAWERNIAKKQAIKRGMIQQLLTGQVRLSGFDGDWMTSTYRDLVRIERGEAFKAGTAAPGTVPVIAAGRSPAAFTDRSNRAAPVVTISSSGASAGFVAYHPMPIFASDCSTISPNPRVDLSFVYYSLLLHQARIYQAQVGGAQPHVHAKDVYPLVVDVPPSVDEQRAIAVVLDDVEAEIVQLKASLLKAQHIWEGLTQQLLTGRTRLPMKEAV